MTSPNPPTPHPHPEKSSKSRLLQYIGVSMIAEGRKYSFRVAELDESDRFFTVLIGNADFLPGKLKYQEGPDICYRKLMSLLAEEKSDCPLCSHQQVSSSEATDYAGAGSVKPKKWGRAPRAERHHPWLP